MSTNQAHKYTNRLINETSPYLLQHAHNPVDWYPWGDEAFEKARTEGKLVLISIGYAACHWCHVMEHESFEDEEVAKIMNEQFVCIKVDREERPDVDHTYMDAVQLLTGRGGWPLNCFALPDGRPVYGGTYFRKEQWFSILQQLSDVYANDKLRVINSADELMKGMSKYNLVKVNNKDSEYTEENLKAIVDNWKPHFDTQDGGNVGAPKFPMPSNFLFLLKYFYYTGDDQVLHHLELSLDKMAAGGIYDALGGGFARYSTDAFWKVPHFEKMLYDNAQLVSVYAQAYKLFQKEKYKQVVYESLDFIERELMSPNGSFYSSIDADSEGEEGTFYIWKKHEIDQLLGKNAPIFDARYGISEKGNWEHSNNVLHCYQSIEQLAGEFDISEKEVKHSLELSRQILFDERNKRERPITDDKVLTSWNALAIIGFVDAYRTFGEDRFLQSAIRAAVNIKANCVEENGRVFRMARDNSNIPGFLDDYSLLAQSFIDLYQATFDEEWLNLSLLITKYAIDNFYDKKTGMFYFASAKETETIINKTEISDNVIPSSNSIMAKVLQQLSIYFENEEFSLNAERMLNNVAPQMAKSGAYFSNWANLMCDYVYQPPEIVFAGDNSAIFRKEFDRNYVYALVAGSKGISKLSLLENRVVEHESLIYVCRNRVCKLPVSSVKDALLEIGNP